MSGGAIPRTRKPACLLSGATSSDEAAYTAAAEYCRIDDTAPDIVVEDTTNERDCHKEAISSDLAVWLLSPQTNVGQRVVVNEEVGSAREDGEREGNVAPSAHGNTGLLNVWRARRTSLVTATAVQQSPAVQTRAFVALSGLAAAEVDDDFLYQILVAFKGILSKANESNTTTIVISSLANSCPEIIGITYDTLQDRIRDTFANSSNAAIIRSVSTIFHVALQDNVKCSNTSQGSTSTLTIS
ncbi:hypothetical protein BJ912DRAFT_1144462 [Pholiota molesta]|nr:hypothetical protein BJ912DRAFT_1144462 [Pholiota molesta]